MSTLELEIISLVDFNNNSSKADIFKRLNHAASNSGIFAITDHGIDSQFFKQCYHKSREFFELPINEKSSIDIANLVPPRGYFPHGVYVQNTQEHPLLTEVRENFVYCMPNRQDYSELTSLEQKTMAEKFFAPVRWPEQVAGFEEQFKQLQTTMWQFSQSLWTLFAEALTLPKDFFIPITSNPTSFTVVNYYKHIDSWNDKYGQYRMSPHTDITAYTIILAEESDYSLQVEVDPGEWVNINAPKGAIVIQIGNIMSHWTNNKWRATKHRVLPPLNSQDNSRVSIIHGVQTNIGVNISKLPIDDLPNNNLSTITCCEHELDSFSKVLNMQVIDVLCEK